jgi:hypothetical protein
MKPARPIVEMILFFLAFFLPGYIAQASAAAAGPATTAVLAQSILTGLPQFLLMAYVAVSMGAQPADRWGFVTVTPRDAARVAALVVGCFAVVTPFIALVLALPPQWSRSLTMGYRWGLQSTAQLPVALVFGLTAGYREEFFFRSYLLRRLGELGVPLPLAAMASTLLFSAGHLYEGVIGIAIAASLGALFTVVYVRRPSLHVIAVAHGLYNTIVLCLSIFLPRALPA